MKQGLAYYRKIFSEIGTKPPASVYLLTGQERFIMEEMSQRLVSSILGDETSSFNFDCEYGSEIDMERLVSTANSYPFLGDRRVIVVKELEKLKGKWKQLTAYCEDPTPSTVLILIEATHDDSGRKIRLPRDHSTLVKVVGMKGEVFTFEKMQRKDLVKWVRQKASRMGVDMGEKEAAILADSVGEDLFSIQNELDKLALVFEGRKVDCDGLARVIGRYRLGAMFEMIDDIRPGNLPAVMSQLSSILESGAERPSTVVYMLTRHFLSLLKVKAGASGGGWFFDKLKKKAGMFSTREILVWLENLREAELVMKSSSYPERLILEGVMLNSMHGRLSGGLDKTA